MGSVKILDCTLREAPIDKLLWGEVAIRKMIHGLENAGVDIIEVGFLKDLQYELGSTSFHRVEDIMPYLKRKKEGTKYVALVDYGRYDLKYLSPYNGDSIDAIRICFKHDEIDKVLGYAEKIRRKGYEVSIQHVDTMGYSDEEILRFVDKVNQFKPFAYSVVDTFGAMYEEDAVHYAKLIDDALDRDIVLGFHGHNNLMMADANAQSFIRELSAKRDVIVDSSLYGCGRGAGNAHTELITRFVNSFIVDKYDLNELLDLIDTVINAVQEKTEWGYTIPYYISGMYNAHTFNVKHLMKRHNLRSKDLRAIIEKLDVVQRKKYDYALLEKLYVEQFDNEVDDSEAIGLLSNVFKDRTILLLAPGKSISSCQDDIKEFIKSKNPIVIGVNNLIDGFKLDYIFFSGAIRYQNLQFQEYEFAKMPKLILTSNIVSNGLFDEMIVNYISLIKFGWVNLDSSSILLLRLLVKCGVKECYAAGMDGYMKYGEAFYKNELDTGLSDADRIEHTNENIEMMKDIKIGHPDFNVKFITDSVYKAVWE